MGDGKTHLLPSLIVRSTCEVAICLIPGMEATFWVRKDNRPLLEENQASTTRSLSPVV
jgi:hypothetical protein